MAIDDHEPDDAPIDTNGFGVNGIFPRRTTTANGKTVPTPGAAIPVDRLDEDLEVHPQSRGISEIHISINTEKIQRELNSDTGPITREIESARENTDDEELILIFTTYTETVTIDFEDGESEDVPVRIARDEAECLVEVLAEHSDIIPVPMFRPLAYAVEDERGQEDLFYDEYRKSVVTFLNHVDSDGSEKDVMGVLSARLPWTCLEGLFEIYHAFDVTAFNFNLDRLKLTADRQVAKVTTMMEFVADMEWEQQCLFYLMNPERGDLDADIGAMPAADLAAIGFGFDVIGTRRVRPRMNYEEFTPDPNLFYLFDRDDYVYQRLQLRNLDQHFPNGVDGSAFDVEEIVGACREDTNRKYDIQPLVNSEQLSLAAMDFRRQESGEPAYWFLRRKTGFTEGLADAMLDVRTAFDQAITARDQTDVTDF